MTVPVLAATPIHFGPHERSLFGWFHAASGPSRDAGVVLCNPIGDDDVRAHRALRHLAEELARRGFSVLRFDFHGTGDSSGSERDAGRAKAWLEDVPLAVKELRTRSGASGMAVVGLRLGGTMAMAACAAAGAVDDLVLWNAYTSGEAYVSETTKVHKMHKMLEPRSFASEPPGWNAGGQETLGFLLTPDTVEGLKKIDLFAVKTRPAARTFVIGGGNVPAEDKILTHLRSLGGEVDYRHLPGQNFLVQINHRSDLPATAIEAIAKFLTERHPVSAAAKTPAPPPAARSMPYGEEPIVFGSAHPLFGILVHPAKEKRDPRRPVVLMTSAGCVHRIGPHRFYASMARRWADLGFWVFRVDLAGIGDSPAAPGSPENLTYPKSALADLDDAMTAATKATGAQTFVVLGLCSGGDLAFQLGFKDRRVVGTVMMNPRTFCVNDLAMVDSYNRARYYEDSVFRVASWKKALRGEVDVKRALRLVAPKVKDIALRRMQRLVSSSRPKAEASEVTIDVPGCLRMMAERGVDTFLVASEKDPGIEFVDVQFGKAMDALKSVRGFRREDFLGTDNTFTSLYAQHRVSEVITEHLASRFGA